MLTVFDHFLQEDRNIKGVFVCTGVNRETRVGVYLGEVPHEINLLRQPNEPERTGLCKVLNRKKKEFGLLESNSEITYESVETYSRSNTSIGCYFPEKPTPTKDVGIIKIPLNLNVELIRFKSNKHALEVMAELFSINT